MLNVFIIDHRLVFRFGIRYLVEHSLKDFSLYDFSSVDEVHSLVHAPSPNLIFLGVETELGGIQVLSKLKKTFHETRIIICNQNAEANEGLNYLRSGAHGYLSRISDPDTLRHCIDVVMEGKFYIDPMNMETLLEELILGRKELSRGKGLHGSTLSPRQSEIAALFAQGLSTSGIAKKLGLSSSTISTVKSKIYEKLKIDSLVDLKDAIY